MVKPTIVQYNTDLEPRLIEQREWDFALAGSEQEVAEAAEKLTGVPAHYVREAMRFNDPIEDNFTVMIHDDHLPPFPALFTALGEHNGCIWGHLETSSNVGKSVNRRFRSLHVIEDPGVLAMINHDDFDHVAVLVRIRDEVVIRIGCVQGDLLEDNDELSVLDALTV